MSPAPNDPNRPTSPTEDLVRRTLTAAAPVDTHVEAGLTDLHDRLGGGAALAPPVDLGARRLAPRRLLAAAAVVVAIAGIGAVLISGDDGPSKVVTQQQDPSATGWYIPEGLSDEWKPTAVRIDTVRTAAPGSSCPCRELVWTNATGRGAIDGGGPVGSITLTRVRSGATEASVVDGVPLEQRIDDIDLGRGVTATGFESIAVEGGAERRDTVITWVDGGSRSVVFGRGISERLTIDAARAVAAAEGIEDPPLEGFELVDDVERGPEAIDGTRVNVILTNTRTGAAVGYVLAAPGSEALDTQVAPAVVDLPGAVGPMLRTAVAPAADGDTGYVTYLGRWPGADVSTGPDAAPGVGDPGAVTDGDVQGVLASLRPASAAEWAAFLDSAPVALDNAAALKVPTLADVDEPAGNGGDEEGETSGSVTETTAATPTFEVQGTPIPSTDITAEDLTISPVLEVVTCGPDLGRSNVVQSTDGELCYLLGGIGADGTDLYRAVASLQESWVVAVEARPEAVDQLNALFDACFEGATECPPQAGVTVGSVAIVLDDTVISAPAVNAPGIASDAFVISADFTEQQASDLAAAINAG